MGKNDLWIAACAATTRATLVTLDRDFEHFAEHIGVARFDTAH